MPVTMETGEGQTQHAGSRASWLRRVHADDVTQRYDRELQDQLAIVKARRLSRSKSTEGDDTGTGQDATRVRSEAHCPTRSAALSPTLSSALSARQLHGETDRRRRLNSGNNIRDAASVNANRNAGNSGNAESEDAADNEDSETHSERTEDDGDMLTLIGNKVAGCPGRDVTSVRGVRMGVWHQTRGQLTRADMKELGGGRDGGRGGHGDGRKNLLTQGQSGPSPFGDTTGNAATSEEGAPSRRSDDDALRPPGDDQGRSDVTTDVIGDVAVGAVGGGGGAGVCDITDVASGGWGLGGVITTQVVSGETEGEWEGGSAPDHPAVTTVLPGSIPAESNLHSHTCYPPLASTPPPQQQISSFGKPILPIPGPGLGSITFYFSGQREVPQNTQLSVNSAYYNSDQHHSPRSTKGRGPRVRRGVRNPLGKKFPSLAYRARNHLNNIQEHPFESDSDYENDSPDDENALSDYDNVFPDIPFIDDSQEDIPSHVPAFKPQRRRLADDFGDTFHDERILDLPAGLVELVPVQTYRGTRDKRRRIARPLPGRASVTPGHLPRSVNNDHTNGIKYSPTGNYSRSVDLYNRRVPQRPPRSKPRSGVATRSRYGNRNSHDEKGAVSGPVVKPQGHVAEVGRFEVAYGHPEDPTPIVCEGGEDAGRNNGITERSLNPKCRLLNRDEDARGHDVVLYTASENDHAATHSPPEPQVTLIAPLIEQERKYKFCNVISISVDLDNQYREPSFYPHEGGEEETDKKERVESTHTDADGGADDIFHPRNDNIYDIPPSESDTRSRRQLVSQDLSLREARDDVTVGYKQGNQNTHYGIGRVHATESASESTHGRIDGYHDNNERPLSTTIPRSSAQSPSIELDRNNSAVRLNKYDRRVIASDPDVKVGQTPTSLKSVPLRGATGTSTTSEHSPADPHDPQTTLLGSASVGSFRSLSLERDHPDQEPAPSAGRSPSTHSGLHRQHGYYQQHPHPSETAPGPGPLVAEISDIQPDITSNLHQVSDTHLTASAHSHSAVSDRHTERGGDPDSPGITEQITELNETTELLTGGATEVGRQQNRYKDTTCVSDAYEATDDYDNVQEDGCEERSSTPQSVASFGSFSFTYERSTSPWWGEWFDEDPQPTGDPTGQPASPRDSPTRTDTDAPPWVTRRRRTQRRRPPWRRWTVATDSFRFRFPQGDQILSTVATQTVSEDDLLSALIEEDDLELPDFENVSDPGSPTENNRMADWYKRSSSMDDCRGRYDRYSRYDSDSTYDNPQVGAPSRLLERIYAARRPPGSTLSGRSAAVHTPRRRWRRTGSSSTSGTGTTTAISDNYRWRSLPRTGLTYQPQGDAAFASDPFRWSSERSGSYFSDTLSASAGYQPEVPRHDRHRRQARLSSADRDGARRGAVSPDRRSVTSEPLLDRELYLYPMLGALDDDGGDPGGHTKQPVEEGFNAFLVDKLLARTDVLLDAERRSLSRESLLDARENLMSPELGFEASMLYPEHRSPEPYSSSSLYPEPSALYPNLPPVYLQCDMGDVGGGRDHMGERYGRAETRGRFSETASSTEREKPLTARERYNMERASRSKSWDRLDTETPRHYRESRMSSDRLSMREGDVGEAGGYSRQWKKRDSEDIAMSPSRKTSRQDSGNRSQEGSTGMVSPPLVGMTYNKGAVENEPIVLNKERYMRGRLRDQPQGTQRGDMQSVSTPGETMVDGTIDSEVGFNRLEKESRSNDDVAISPSRERYRRESGTRNQDTPRGDTRPVSSPPVDMLDGRGAGEVSSKIRRKGRERADENVSLRSERCRQQSGGQKQDNQSADIRSISPTAVSLTREAVLCELDHSRQRQEASVDIADDPMNHSRERTRRESGNRGQAAQRDDTRSPAVSVTSETGPTRKPTCRRSTSSSSSREGVTSPTLQTATTKHQTPTASTPGLVTNRAEERAAVTTSPAETMSASPTEGRSKKEISTEPQRMEDFMRETEARPKRSRSITNPNSSISKIRSRFIEQSQDRKISKDNKQAVSRDKEMPVVHKDIVDKMVSQRVPVMDSERDSHVRGRRSTEEAAGRGKVTSQVNEKLVVPQAVTKDTNTSATTKSVGDADGDIPSSKPGFVTNSFRGPPTGVRGVSKSVDSSNIANEGTPVICSVSGDRSTSISTDSPDLKPSGLAATSEKTDVDLLARPRGKVKSWFLDRDAGKSSAVFTKKEIRSTPTLPPPKPSPVSTAVPIPKPRRTSAEPRSPKSSSIPTTPTRNVDHAPFSVAEPQAPPTAGSPSLVGEWECLSESWRRGEEEEEDALSSVSGLSTASSSRRRSQSSNSSVRKLAACWENMAAQTSAPPSRKASLRRTPSFDKATPTTTPSATPPVTPSVSRTSSFNKGTPPTTPLSLPTAATPLKPVATPPATPTASLAATPTVTPIQRPRPTERVSQQRRMGAPQERNSHVSDRKSPVNRENDNQEVTSPTQGEGTIDETSDGPPESFGESDEDAAMSRVKDERTGRSRYVREAKPSFIIKPRRQFVDEGLVAKFKASFDGEPVPTLNWDKDGDTIQDGGRYKLYDKNDFHFLEISDVSTEDKGNYTATITNSLGSAKCSAELEIFCKPQFKTRRKTAPKVEKELSSLSVEDGERTQLVCHVTGNPQPTVTWYHNSRILTSSDDVKQEYSGKEATLTFTEVYPEDSGTYECVASNSQGDARSTAKLTVKEPKPKTVAPAVTSQLEDQAVTEGDRLTLQVTVTGVPPPAFTWYRGARTVRPSRDVVMDDEGGVATLVVKEAGLGDTGTYRCRAQNEAGSVDSRCSVKVKEEEPPPPPVPKSPPPMLPKSPPPEPEAPPTFRSSRQSKFETSRAEPKAEPTPVTRRGGGRGLAELRATPTAAPPAPKPAPPPEPKGPSFIKALKDITVNDADRVEMEVEVAGAQPMEIIWLHGDKEIKKNSTVYQIFSEGNTHRLVIPEVYPEDAGLYICEAYNEVGDEDSACKLSVQDTGEEDYEDQNNNATYQSSYKSSQSINNVSKFQNSPSPKKTVSKPELIQPAEPLDKPRSTSLKVPKPTLPEPVYDEEPEFLAKPLLKPSKRPAPAKIAEPEPEFLSKPVLKPSRRPTPSKIAEPEPEFLAKPILKPSNRPRPQKRFDPEPEFLSKPILKPSTKQLPGKKSDPEPEFLAKPILKPSRKPKLEPLPKTEPEFLAKSILKPASKTVPAPPPKPATQQDSADSGSESVNERSRDYGRGDPQDADEEDEVEEAEELYRRKKKQNGIRSYNDDASDDADDEPYAPEFMRKPRSAHVDEGNPAHFSCCIMGNPQPEVTWQKDGTELEEGGRIKIISDGDNHLFEIVHSLATDAGRYLVVATNSQGTASCSVSLMVKELDNAEVSDFRSLLRSSSSGKRDLSTRPQLKNLGAGVLNAEAEQIDFRNVLTRHVKTKQRPKVVRDLEDVRVVEGQTAVLRCKIVGVPEPRVTWYFNKRKEIKESKFFHMTYEDGVSQLVIAEVYPEDVGDYLVKAINEAGLASTSCDLKFKHDEALSSEGDCPPPIPDNHPEMPPTPEPAPLVPQMEPPFIEDLSPDNVHAVVGASFVLRAKFVAQPAPVIRWSKDRKELRTSNGRINIETAGNLSTLTMHDIDVVDSGRYTVSVQNEMGCDTCDSSVTVEDRPDPPCGRPAASKISGTSLTLSWYGPSYDGGSIITHYKVEQSFYEPVSWSTLSTDCKFTSMQVKGLKPDTEYIFRVSAANKHGFSEPGKMSEVVVTIDHQQRSSLRIGGTSELDTLSSAGPPVSPFYISSPLSPDAYRAARDEMTFEPRHVTVDPSRNLHDFYTLGEEIGKGRFGNVYACIERDSKRKFAAKMIKVKASQRDETRQEIDVMNRLHHPKLLLLWDAFESPRQIILIMEHVAGGELFERIIDDDYCLTERECVHFMRQICDGVAFMHSQNILHLDLKPENVLCITPNSNEIKIIDFGLARTFDPKKNFKVMFGTPEFVAPEVVNYENIDYATDMWSVGVICYILLSGLSPFLGDNESGTLVNVTMAQWDFDDEIFDDISDDAKDFIEGLLDKNMKERMDSGASLAHRWLAQDVKFMRAKRLSTEKHKRFMARRKWQSGEVVSDARPEECIKSPDQEKTGNAIRALGRMASFQKSLSGLNLRSGANSDSAADMRSRASDASSSASEPVERAQSERAAPVAAAPPTAPRARQRTRPAPPENSLSTKTSERDSGIEAPSPEGNSSDEERAKRPPIGKREQTTFTSRTTASITLGSASSAPTTRRRPTTNGTSGASTRQAVEAAPPVATVPVFLKKMRDFEVYEGDSARFDVAIQGTPPPEVTWYKEDEEIPENRHYVVDQHDNGVCSLIIKNCQEEDDAAYSCRIKNSEGEETCAADLYVEVSGLS